LLAAQTKQLCGSDGFAATGRTLACGP
jgi:hypothetical protein